MKDFFGGLVIPLEACLLIVRNKKLMLQSILPVGVTVILYIVGFFLVIPMVTRQFDPLLARTGLSPESFLFSVAHVMIGILLITGGLLTFSLVANLIATPFNDFLAEAAERFTYPPLVPMGRLGWRGRIRQIGIDLTKSLAGLFIASLLFLISFVPVIGLVAMVAGPFLLAYEFISYPQTRRSIGLARSTGFLWKHRMACFGFGLSCALLFLIPFLSCLVLPMAVVGGTLLFAKHEFRPNQLGKAVSLTAV